MRSRDRFSRVERRAVLRAAQLAEELTGCFYRIPGREWPRYPYEVRTLAAGPGPEAPVFAEVVRLVRVRADAPGSHQRPRRDVYGIRLRDDAILGAVGRDENGIRLFPLLLYVLTHELVHVVRFAGGLAAFDASPDERSAEEARVHAVTHKVLRPANDPDLSRVLHVYREEVLRSPEGGCSPK